MDTNTIALTKLRELHLAAPSQTQRPSHLSAASGLVALDDHLYVVADDELQLGRFPKQGDAAGELIRILPGELPLPPKERKRAKPDFEALVHVPAFGRCPHGALLAMGSGSTSARHRAVLLPLDANQQLSGEQRVVDLRVLHDAVAQNFGVPNVEGALLTDDRVLLFQRGNKGAGINAIITFARGHFEAVLRGDAIAITPLDVQRYDLGVVNNVPLGFSDAALLANGTILFAAIAEDTDNAYADGPCAGAAIGSIDANGELQRIVRTREPAKIEGLCVVREGVDAELWLVTDADDASVPATLCRATWPLSV